MEQWSTGIKAKIKHLSSKFNIRETLSYTWVGFVGVGIDFVMFLILRSVFDTPPAVASMLSAATAATLTFPLNAHFTFQKNDDLHKRFIMYLVINGFGTLLGGSLVFIGFNLIGLNDKVVKFIATFVVAATQFILNKFIAFK